MTTAVATDGEDGKDESNPYDMAPNPGYAAAQADDAINREDRWIWIARISLSLNAVLGVAVVGLALAITHLTPLQKVVPFIVGFKPEAEGIVTVSPIAKEWTTNGAAHRAWVARYVKEREEMLPNRLLMEGRWEDPGYFLRLVSTTKVWDRFIPRARDVLNRIERAGVTRDVKIGAIRLERTAPVIYQIDFTTHDYKAESLSIEEGKPLGSPTDTRGRVDQKEWTATVQVTHLKQRQGIPLHILQTNPFLMLVTSYEVRRVGRQ